jgi:hypothetical protein
MMSRVEELEFLSVIMEDLKNNYPEHNKKVLQDMIQSVQYKLQCEVKQEKQRFRTT